MEGYEKVTSLVIVLPIFDLTYLNIILTNILNLLNDPD